jgi:hypothetical protein
MSKDAAAKSLLFIGILIIFILPDLGCKDARSQQPRIKMRMITSNHHSVISACSVVPSLPDAGS